MSSSCKNKNSKLVIMTGIDGAGKTLYAKRLVKELKKIGVEIEYIWSRYNNFFSKPLLALTYLTGHNYREYHQGFRFGYHDFGRSKTISWLFTFLQAIDLNLATRVKINRQLKGANYLVCDRGPYDTLIDVMLDTGRDLLNGKQAEKFLKSLPENHLVFYIYRPLTEIYKSRPELKHDKNLPKKYKLYQSCCDYFSWKRIENVGTPETVFNKIISELK